MLKAQSNKLASTTLTCHPTLVALCRSRNWATTKLLDCSCLAGWRNGLAHNDSRDLNLFGLKLPYVRYERVVLSLYSSSPGAQSCWGAYKPSSSKEMVFFFFIYVCWIPFLYFKWDPLFTQFYC